MRAVSGSVVAMLSAYALVFAADAPKPPQPTRDELEAVNKAYSSLAMRHRVEKNPVTGDPVHEWSFFVTRLTDDNIKTLPDPPFPYGWATGGNRMFTDAGLKGVGGRKWLTSLSLSQTKVTDAGVKELAGLKNLAYLRLEDTAVGDEGLKALAGLTSLGELHLSNTRVTDAGMKHLRGLTEMRTLSLGGTKVTAAGLRELAGMKKLALLDFGGPQLTDEALRVLSDAGKLHTIYAAQKRPGRPASHDEIQEFMLWRCPAGDDGLKLVCGLKNVRRVTIDGTKVTPAGLKALAGLPKLEELRVPEEQLTDAFLKGLREAGVLHRLTVAYTKDFKRPATADAVYRLNLKKSTITDAGVKELAGLVNLGDLTLEGTALTDMSVKDLAALKNLNRLDIMGTRITMEGLKELRAAWERCNIRGPVMGIRPKKP